MKDYDNSTEPDYLLDEFVTELKNFRKRRGIIFLYGLTIGFLLGALIF